MLISLQNATKSFRYSEFRLPGFSQCASIQWPFLRSAWFRTWHACFTTHLSNAPTQILSQTSYVFSYVSEVHTRSCNACGIADIQVSNLKATRLHDCDTLHPKKYSMCVCGKQIEERKYPDAHFKKSVK